MRAYKTIGATGIAEFEDRKSRFIGHVAHVESEEQAVEFRHGIREAIPEASHYVSAYIIHETGLVHYSDAKEPHGTAGPPVLSVIEHHGLEDVVCVVARIFGGTLLGRGGLMRAYTKAAQRAVAQARIVLRAPVRDVLASIEYSLYEQAMRLLDDAGAQVLGTDFGAEVTIEFRTLAERCDETCARLTELSLGRAELLAGDEKLELIDWPGSAASQPEDDDGDEPEA